MTPEQLKEVLDKHAKWLHGEEGGQRADLRGADLRGADLSSAYLSGANLSSADLSSAYLSGANLSSANLSSANLIDAYLSSADLSGANLRGANLRGAKLRGANLIDANLYAWAQVAFSGHGEMGRMLTAIIQTAGADAMYQCGCFYGTDQELRIYIEDGDEQHRPSRLLALDSVNAMLKMSIERKG